jgi:hypothetical protein
MYYAYLYKYVCARVRACVCVKVRPDSCRSLSALGPKLPTNCDMLTVSGAQGPQKHMVLVTQIAGIRL